MRSHAIIAALSLATVFVVFDGSSAHAQTQNDNIKPATNVVVQPGDSLSKIATANSTTYVRLYDANAQIAHPDVIHPGEKLKVPAANEVLASRPIPGASQAAPAVQKKLLHRSHVQPDKQLRLLCLILEVVSGIV